VRWEVKGVDKMSAADRCITIDADDEKSAAAAASRAGMFTESCTRITPVWESLPPALPVTARPSPRRRKWHRKLRKRHVLMAQIGAVVVCTAMTTWWTINRRGGTSTDGRATGAAPSWMMRRTLRISYDEITRDVDRDMILRRETAMDGTPRFVGEGISGITGMLVEGDVTDVQYAHYWVCPNARSNTDETLRGLVAMGHFLDRVAPGWSEGERWLATHLAGERGEYEITVDGRHLKLTVNPPLSKLAVDPAPER
jgi:hypothetical protein